MTETTPPLRLLPPHTERLPRPVQATEPAAPVVPVEPPAPAVPLDLGSEDVLGTISVAALAFVALRRHTRALLANEAGTRLGNDPERLHDMRVASRRLRAALSLFRDYLPKRGEALRRELARVASTLGAVRDLDVRLEQLASWRSGVAPEDVPALNAIEAILVKQRHAARGKLLRVLDAARYKHLTERLVAFVQHGPTTRPALGKRPAIETAGELLDSRFRKAHKAGKRLSRHSAPEAFHRVRIHTKRLRYALEFHGPLFDGQVRPMIERLTVLQDLLGEHQDAHVATLQLEALAKARRPLPPRALFLMGTIASRLERRAEELRREFKKAFKEIRPKPWKAMMRAVTPDPASPGAS